MTMFQKHAGWFVLAGAVFMMLTLMSVEVAALDSWALASAPAFVGRMLGHVGTVGAAWLAGKLMPQFGDSTPPAVPSVAVCQTCGQPIGDHAHEGGV
jgi:hypothetical protein